MQQSVFYFPQLGKLFKFTNNSAVYTKKKLVYIIALILIFSFSSVGIIPVRSLKQFISEDSAKVEGKKNSSSAGNNSSNRAVLAYFFDNNFKQPDFLSHPDFPADDPLNRKAILSSDNEFLRKFYSCNASTRSSSSLKVCPLKQQIEWDFFRKFRVFSDEIVDREFSKAFVSKFIFASCSKQARNNTEVWAKIMSVKPDVFFWTGDAIYPVGNDVLSLAKAYHMILANTGYVELKKNLKFLDGTWDDHDFGVNDGGKEYKFRDASQQLFLDFLDVSSSDSRRSRDGVYSSHLFHLESDSKNVHQTVKVILLDTRYSRDVPWYFASQIAPESHIFMMFTAGLRWLTSYLGFNNFYSGDVLGENQWRWLENQLADSSSAAHVIVSSIQVFSSLHFTEGWDHYGIARHRLFDIIKRTKPRGLVFVSGDVHFAELLGLEDKVLEITSSGLTHSIEEKFSSFSIIKKLFLPFLSFQRTKSDQLYLGRNFCLMEFKAMDDEGTVMEAYIFGDDTSVKLYAKQRWKPNEDLEERFAYLDTIENSSKRKFSALFALQLFCLLLAVVWCMQIVIIMLLGIFRFFGTFLSLRCFIKTLVKKLS